MAKMFTSKTELTCTQIADAADKMIRERWGDAYEVLFDGENGQYAVAAPRDGDEGGDPMQPTAICCGRAGDFDDPEDLYEAARSMTDRVDELAAQLAERDY